jgi:predicted small integral membrane protein
MLYTVRLIKIGFVATIALFFSVVAFDNFIDHETNLTFVQHVLSMDTTFHNPTLMRRAVTNINVQNFFYFLIIAWEMLTGVMCWIGALVMTKNIAESSTTFHESKSIAFIGLFFGVMLFMLGFIILGGEWFSMWQSPYWNGQNKAGLFISMIMFVLIFLNTRDGD